MPFPRLLPFTTDPDATFAAGSGRKWRVGHTGRDQMYYEELVEGSWERISVDGEMLLGRAHHAIFFRSPEAWKSLPGWAQGRRTEIIARIKSQFREPDYEYYGDGDEGTGSGLGVAPGDSPADPVPVAMSQCAVPAVPRQGSKKGLYFSVLVLLAVSVGAFWYANKSVKEGKTTLPTRHGGSGHPVFLKEDPVLFWTCVGAYGVAGMASTGLAAWLLIAARKPK
jgi:hypothetical protein